jgi:trans-aconitate methyltransferase
VSRLRTLAFEDYLRCYERANAGMNPTTMPQRMLTNMQLMYGELVAKVPEGGRVLDVGCGTGFLLRWLSQQPGVVAVGVDSSAPIVEAARRALPETEVACADGLE